MAASALRTSYLLRDPSCTIDESRHPSPVFGHDRVLVQEAHPYHDLGRDTASYERAPVDTHAILSHVEHMGMISAPRKTRMARIRFLTVGIVGVIHSLVVFADRTTLTDDKSSCQEFVSFSTTRPSLLYSPFAPPLYISVRLLQALQ